MKRRLLVVHDRLGGEIAEAAGEFALCPLPLGCAAEAWLRANGAGLEAAVVSSTARFDRAVFDLLPDLRLIAVAAAGFTGIDLDEARRRGIAVTTGGGRNAGDVADLAVLMLLALVRGLLDHDRFVRSGDWSDRPPVLGRSMSAQRVGVVGLGHVGTAAAVRLAAFGCSIRWWGPRARPDPAWPREEQLIGLARWATALIVTARADRSSSRIVSADVISALGPDGAVVNVSRGCVVDEAALRAALVAGELGGAGLDVFETEPTPADRWVDVPNVVLTPHIGGATTASVQAVIEVAMENVRRHFRGRPLLHRVA